jgi:hypothetical protein
MRRLPTLLLAVLFSTTAIAAEPAKPAFDPQVKKQLEDLDYKYKIDEDGDFQLTFEVDGKDKRSQLVFVRSPVETYGDHRIREIWSPAYKSPDKDFPVAVANRLLEASQASKMGAWAKQNDYAVFVVKLSADASAKELEDAIAAAFVSADEMEAELTPGKDDF